MLIGPNAPVVFEPIHGIYMSNTYDFYKPKLDLEYPEVDGPVSVVNYIAALDAAYARFREKHAKAAKRAQLAGVPTEKSAFSIEDIDHAIFHSPQTSSERLWPSMVQRLPRQPILSPNVEKTFINASKAAFKQKTEPAMACSRRLGNTYTGPLYQCLASLLSTTEPEALRGKRINTRGVLTLLVTKETYERLGLMGARVPFKAQRDYFGAFIWQGYGCGGWMDVDVGCSDTPAVAEERRVRDESRAVERGARGLGCAEGWRMERHAGLLRSVPLGKSQVREVVCEMLTSSDVYIPIPSLSLRRHPHTSASASAGQSNAGADSDISDLQRGDDDVEDWNAEIAALFEWVGMASLGSQ
ncbi:hypothetical protein C0992_007275, partial [Termitomyces sp. T32_za158]